jgi:hypothetical protein
MVGPGWGRWSAEVLAGAGVRTDGELAERLHVALAPLQRVRVDAVLLLHDRRTTVADAVTHLRRWLLLDEARARLIVATLAGPRTRTRPVAHVHGSALVATFLQGAAVPTVRHRWLMDAMPAPASLRGRLAAV